MKKALVTLSYIPVRSEPSEKSELVTQLLFGEIYEIIEEKEKWMKIRNIYDNYEGWISYECHINNIADQEFISSLKESELIFNKMLLIAVDSINNYNMFISPGSIFYKNLFINEKTYKLYHYTLKLEIKNSVSTEDIILQFVNTPYLWGGRTIFGIDCSALVQVIFRILGVDLPRDAFLQYNYGKNIDNYEKIKPFDVAFFGEQAITHVGVLLNDTTIIHSSGKVRIDKFERGKGIFNSQMNNISHKFIGIKRFLN